MNEILKLLIKDEWRYCFGEDNLVDIGLRGVMSLKLKDNEL